METGVKTFTHLFRIQSGVVKIEDVVRIEFTLSQSESTFALGALVDYSSLLVLDRQCQCCKAAMSG